MTVFFVVLIAVVLFVIAAVAIGRETYRLEGLPPKPNFETDTAATWIGDRLAPEIASVLSYDDVQAIVVWSTQFFAQKGVQTNGVNHWIDTPVIVGAAELVDYVLQRAEAEAPERSLDAVLVGAVVEQQLAYLDTIGAVGPKAGDRESSQLGDSGVIAVDVVNDGDDDGGGGGGD